LWDNSPNKISKVDEELLTQSFPNFEYMHTPENIHLSELYNRVINRFITINDYLILFDHDSEIPQMYFEELYLKIYDHPEIDLFLPHVIAKKQIVSPAYEYIIKSKYWKTKKSGLIKSNHITAINSGMAISGRFLTKFSYDKRLKNYGTDNFLMKAYRKINSCLYVLDTTIDHDLNFLSGTVLTKVMVFSETKKSNLIINSDNLFDYVLAKVNNTIVSIKLSIIYRDLRFLKR
jgi:hypothetical protein